MNDTYTVRVTKDYLVFCAGHFITYNGGECERLHGHNWRVAVEIDGPLDENHYVFDFIALKDRTLEICQELDHRMLIATKNPLLTVNVTTNEVEVRFQNKRWVFPHADCAILDIANTTAELLAHYFTMRLWDILKSKHQYVPNAIRVEVEESFGQIATCHS